LPREHRNKRSPRGEKEAALSSLTHTSSATLNESDVHISARNNSRGVFSRGLIYLRQEKHRIEEPFSVYEQERVIRASLIGSIDPFRWSTIGRPIANRHEQQLFSGCHCSGIRIHERIEEDSRPFLLRDPNPPSLSIVRTPCGIGKPFLGANRPIGIPGERDREIFTFRSLLVRHFEGTTERSRTGAVTSLARSRKAADTVLPVQRPRCTIPSSPGYSTLFINHPPPRGRQDEENRNNLYRFITRDASCKFRTRVRVLATLDPESDIR